uniref:Fungal lipase-type domain-containing protein n=1 Tax=Eutreptiella gymnastica TaxID=73025 RepID=A0A7S1JBZ8_9EUGL|mmetsp:Transcript_82155/g.145123  ORF Transcript_82155/g.145123 Transcript_82155/m.145123 type:complete len:345 (+) Transcript_82155:293-1327(+)
MVSELVEHADMVYNVNSTEELFQAIRDKQFTVETDKGPQLKTWVWKNHYDPKSAQFFSKDSCAGCHLGLDTQFHFVKGTTEDGKPYGVLCFRGTSSKQDIAADADMVLVTAPDICPRGKIHRGFTNQLNPCLTHIDSFINSLDPSAMLYVTGHSLGGSLGTLATSYIANKHPKWIGNLRTYVFAAPRVGDRDACRWINSKVKHIFNVCEDGDPVPVGTLKSMGYDNVGTMLTRFAGSEWAVGIAPDAGTKEFWRVRNHKLGSPTPVGCNMNYRCDVPTMPDKLEDFANVGGEKALKGRCYRNCDPNAKCGRLSRRCVCKSGYYAGDGGQKCLKYPDGFVAKELP